MKSSPLMTRREMLELLGATAAASSFPAAVFAQASPTPPVFPKGAIIRTILKDYAPEELAGGATLFHEHMQLAQDFMPRFLAAAAAVRAANGLPAAPGRGGAAGGAARAGGPPPGPDIMRDVDLMSAEVANAKRDGNVACIVDAGHPDMGRDINFLRQVSMKSGVPIVAGGGFYSQPFYPEGNLDDERGADRVRRSSGRRTTTCSARLARSDRGMRSPRMNARCSARSARRTSRRTFRSSRTRGFPGSRHSNSSTSSKTPASNRIVSSSATSGISSTRTSTCTSRSAGGAHSSASIGRAATATRSRCRWSWRSSRRASPIT